MYTIIKVLNNNTVLAKHDHEEIIVMFKGIGFGKKAGEYLEIPPQAKKYLMQKTYQSKDRFQNIIEYIDPIYLEIADEILKRRSQVFTDRSQYFITISRSYPFYNETYERKYFAIQSISL